MKSHARRHYLLAAAVLGTASFTHAAAGTWTDVTGGLWSDTANWSGGIVADANTFNANFSTLDITADTTVSLDSARTLSSLTFGDTTTASAAGWILDNNGNAANILTLGTTPTITVNALGTGKNVTISAELAGSAGLTKAGAGTLVLTAANSYTGTTIISGGTLALSGGNNRLATTGTVNFSAAGTLDVGSTSQSLVNLTVGNTITGTVAGTGGTLSLTGSAFALGGGANQTNTLNMAGLSNFAYNNAAGTFRVSGVTNTTTNGGAGTLTLAGGTNTITASTFGMGDFGSSVNSSVNSGTVNLGTTNTINANTITVGGNRGAGVLQYLTGINTPTLTLRGADGTSRVTSMILSDQGGPSTTGTVQGVVDLTTNVTGTSTLDAKITTLTIGKNTRNTGAGGNSIVNSGTFTMGAGTLDATTINLAQNTAGFTAGGTSTTTGTLTVGTGGTIKVGNFYFADQNTTGAGASALSATFNLNGGANLYATTIAKGPGTGTFTATRTFNWNDGTIRNYDASTDLTFGSGIAVNLAATGTHTFDIDSGRTGSVASVLAGTNGTLAKAGSGTLILTGVNTFTGGTTISAGTLLANNASGSGLGSGAVAVNAGVLGGTGFITNTAITVASGATLQGGAGLATGTLTINSGVTLADGSIIKLALNGAGADKLARAGGTWTFDADQAFNLVDLGGATGAYTLISGLTGSETGLGTIGTWQNTSGLAGSFSLVGNNVVFTAVPEPSTYGLIGAGALAGVALVRRRRKLAGKAA